MGPREAAALVAREADAGVAAALSAIDASGALIPEQITARVASVPEGGADLKDVIWQAEVTMVPGEGGAAVVVGGDGGEQTVDSPVAALPVAGLRGAGPSWSARLTRIGWETIGDLAAATSAELIGPARRLGSTVLALAGLARLAVQPWPVLPGTARSWGSVLDVAQTDPATLSGDKVAAHAAWALAVELVAAVDGDLLAKLPMSAAQD